VIGVFSEAAKALPEIGVFSAALKALPEFGAFSEAAKALPEIGVFSAAVKVLPRLDPGLFGEAWDERVAAAVRRLERAEELIATSPEPERTVETLATDTDTVREAARQRCGRECIRGSSTSGFILPRSLFSIRQSIRFSIRRWKRFARPC
jgi:hypothetical protein